LIHTRVLEGSSDIIGEWPVTSWHFKESM